MPVHRMGRYRFCPAEASLRLKI